MEIKQPVRVISPGIAIGNAFKIRGPDLCQNIRTEFNLETELKRFTGNVEQIVAELSDLRENITTEIDARDAEILKTHQMILTDKSFHQKVIRIISEELVTVEVAVDRIMQKIAAQMLTSKNEYFRARAEDFTDMAKYFRNLSVEKSVLSQDVINGNTILISSELLPSTVLSGKKQSVAGIVAENGTPASHAAILARAFGIPVLVTYTDLSDVPETGNPLILDGFSGELIIHPDSHTILTYRQRIKENRRTHQLDPRVKNRPAETIDGTRVILGVNIERLDELPLIDLSQVDEIGLFRTEFLFMFDQNDFPGFDRQLVWYRKTMRYMEGKSVIFRILDVGGDKFLPYFSMGAQDNPYLGLRAHRVFRYHPEIFKTQLLAILTAAEGNPVKILYPMINDLEELDFLNQILETVDSGSGNIQVGTMIETPAAVFQIDKLMQHVDFVSIGTNDLVQYALIVDRNNQNVLDYYQPFSPVILQMIQKIVEAGDKFGKPVSICGEIASDPCWTPLLLGLGIHSLSMSPLLLPAVKKQIQSLTMKNCRELARKVLQADFVADVLGEMETFRNRNGY